jgi:hypothetical protein
VISVTFVLRLLAKKAATAAVAAAAPPLLTQVGLQQHVGKEDGGWIWRGLCILWLLANKAKTVSAFTV